jgi:hypothetical protein
VRFLCATTMLESKVPPLRAGLDASSDDEDGADQSADHAAPPVPSP